MSRVLLLILFPLSVLFSNEYYPGDSLVWEGVHAFYNYEFDHSVKILTKAREIYPDHPGVHLVWAASRWVRSKANDPVERTYEILEFDLNEIIPVYNALVTKYPLDQTFELYRGSAIGLGARVALGKKDWLKTLYRGYKGFSIINDVAGETPELQDAKLPIGIVEYYTGLSNILLKWAVELYGLDPSRESGLRQMSIAADNGDWTRIEAKSILSFLYLWVEDEPVLAAEYARDLQSQFPNNFYFKILFLESMIRTEQYELSEIIIEDIEIISSNLTNRQQEWYLPYLDYERGLFFFHLKQYDKALEYLEKAISQYTGELDVILSNAFLLKGMILDLQYRRLDAKSSYYACLKLDNFSSSMEKAKAYLKQPYKNP